MFTATTLCYVPTESGEVKQIAGGEPIPDDAIEADLERLRAAGAIVEAKTTPAKPSGKSGT